MNDSLRNLYIVGVSIFLFFITLYLFMTVEKGYDQSAVNVYAAFAIGMIIFQGINNFTIRSQKSWFQIDIMFLMMFFLVHFWLWISVQSPLGRFLRIPKSYLINVNYSVALSLLGLSSFILGFNFWVSNIEQPEYRIESAPHWRTAGNSIFYIGAIFTCLYVFSFGTQAFEGRYSGSEVGNLATRSVYLLQGMFVKLGISIIFISYADQNRIIPSCKIPLLVLAIVLGMYLVLGDRSEFIYTLAVALFSYARSYRKIPLTALIIGIATVSFLMSAVQIARTGKSRSLGQISSVIVSDSEKISVAAGFSGISASGGVLLGAVTAIPKKHDYFYGDLKKTELLGIIPFGRFLFLDSSSTRKFHTTSDFLTWYILGPQSKTGTGTTVVADLFVDFGAIGVVLGLTLLGFVANFIGSKTEERPSVPSVVLYCYFAGLLVLLPRYSFLDIVRGLIWPALALWALNYFFVQESRTS